MKENKKENVVWIADTTPIHKGVIEEKDVAMQTQEIVTQDFKEAYAKSMMPEHWK